MSIIGYSLSGEGRSLASRSVRWEIWPSNRVVGDGFNEFIDTSDAQDMLGYFRGEGLGTYF
jgi:hypothetical protein